MMNSSISVHSIYYLHCCYVEENVDENCARNWSEENHDAEPS